MTTALVLIDPPTWTLQRFIGRKRFERCTLTEAENYTADVVRDVIEAFREKGKDV